MKEKPEEKQCVELDRIKRRLTLRSLSVLLLEIYDIVYEPEYEQITRNDKILESLPVYERTGLE